MGTGPDESTGTGQYEQVTVLCRELPPPEEPGRSLDPEEVPSLLARFLERARREVERYGGTLLPSVDQGFHILFGAPVALEDHARQAVLTVLGLQRATAEEAGVRVGIATGSIVVNGAGAVAVGEATVRAGELLRQPGAQPRRVSQRRPQPSGYPHSAGPDQRSAQEGHHLWTGGDVS